MSAVIEQRTRVLRRVMLFWTLFIGLGAVAGSVGMLVQPDGSALGMDAMLPNFQVLPFADVLFQDFVFPGIALLVVNGLTNLVAAYLIFRKKTVGAYLGCAFGVTLMMWITIQFFIFEFNIMSTSYFVFGFFQFVCGLLYIISLKQGAFAFDESDYHHIGEKQDVLVVYYSRTGYSKKIAYEKADELGAELYEIKTPERTSGLLGFMWLGRFGMHGWDMPINKVDIDATKYKKTIIVTPIHVFSAASPTKGFCKACAGKLDDVSYISVHFRKDSDFAKAFDGLDKLLGVRAAERESVVCKFGRVIRRTKLPLTESAKTLDT